MLKSWIKRLQSISNWIRDQKQLRFPFLLNIPLWLVLYILSLRCADVIFGHTINISFQWISARNYMRRASLRQAMFWHNGFNMGPKPLYLGSLSDRHNPRYLYSLLFLFLFLMLAMIYYLSHKLLPFPFKCVSKRDTKTRLATTLLLLWLWFGSDHQIAMLTWFLSK